MIDFLYIIAAFVALVLIATAIDQVRLGRHRGISRDAFIEAFQQQGIPKKIPAAVYDYYKSSAISNRFTLSPSDSYSDVFHEGSEDIDDDAEALVQQLGMEMPIVPVLRQWEKPIKTLGDMVLWLDWIRQL